MGLLRLFGCYVFYRMRDRQEAIKNARSEGSFLAFIFGATLALIWTFFGAYKGVNRFHEDYVTIFMALNIFPLIFLSLFFAILCCKDRIREYFIQQAVDLSESEIIRIGQKIRVAMILYAILIEFLGILNLVIFYPR